MFWNYVRQKTHQAVLQGLKDAVETMGEPKKTREIEAPMAVAMSELEVALCIEAAGGKKPPEALLVSKKTNKQSS